MSHSLDSTVRDPLDMTVTQMGGWVCQRCSVEQANESTYCQMCLYARPLDRHGVPQIFSGYTMHFNGIIPHNLVHPSHAIEWRMAERHGAVCVEKYDPHLLTTLVYRPGYERSDKCRDCVEKHGNVSVVPITWMLDSLLQSRQIYPSLYTLKAIPAVANSIVSNTDLPHKRHPFYLLNASDYAIPTSYPPRRAGKRGAGDKQQQQQRQLQQLQGATAVGTAMNRAQLLAAAAAGGLDEDMPPSYTVPPLQHTYVDVFDAALKCGSAAGSGGSGATSSNNNSLVPGGGGSSAGMSKSPMARSHARRDGDVEGGGSSNNDDDDNDGDDSGADEAAEGTARHAGLSLLASQQAHNRVDRMLFTGLVCALTPTLAGNAAVVQVLQLCGARIVSVSDGDAAAADAQLCSEVTHVVYAGEDKKCALMQRAAALLQSKRTQQLRLVQVNWLEDCLVLGELLPLCVMYVPTPKLMQTLGNKFARHA